MKRLAVFSHKTCWPCASSPSGYATDGGFPMQMRAISELFESTTLVVPCDTRHAGPGCSPLEGHNLLIRPLTVPRGAGLHRKIRFSFWLARNLPTILHELSSANAVHAPVPGDVGTIGMVLAFVCRKPLFVRHCGNWFVQRTVSERFWKWFMECFAGGRSVMLATGGGTPCPSVRNAAVRWIFSTSLTAADLTELASQPRTVLPGRRLIIACRQDVEKGTGRVIEALPELLCQFPDLSLAVVGDGPALSTLRASADALGVAPAVTFHGKVAQRDVLGLLLGADLFCYPTSASEGFPKVVLEALACGLPVVTTRVSVLPQLIDTGCGVLLDDVSPKTIAAAVRNCLDDRSRLSEMSVAARASAKRYSLEQWRDEIHQALSEAWGRYEYTAR